MNMRLETKQDFRDWMFSVLNPLKPLYSEGGARLHLGDSGVTYPEVSKMCIRDSIRPRSGNRFHRAGQEGGYHYH